MRVAGVCHERGGCGTSAVGGGSARAHGRVQLGLEGAVPAEALSEAREQQVAARLLAVQPEDLGPGGEQGGGLGVAAPVLAADDGAHALAGELQTPLAQPLALGGLQ
jgi:hypothetical protein